MMNKVWYLNVSRNVASHFIGGLIAGSIPWKGKLTLTSKDHVGG
jgi:hypothetical protein